MAYFTFEDAWLEPSQSLDVCFYPEQSFQSDSERDVFQQLLYLRVSLQTSPTIRSLTGFSLQCFTVLFHTFLYNTLEGKLNRRNRG